MRSISYLWSGDTSARKNYYCNMLKAAKFLWEHWIRIFHEVLIPLPITSIMDLHNNCHFLVLVFIFVAIEIDPSLESLWSTSSLTLVTFVKLHKWGYGHMMTLVKMVSLIFFAEVRTKRTSQNFYRNSNICVILKMPVMLKFHLFGQMPLLLCGGIYDCRNVRKMYDIAVISVSGFLIYLKGNLFSSTAFIGCCWICLRNGNVEIFSILDC